MLMHEERSTLLAILSLTSVTHVYKGKLRLKLSLHQKITPFLLYNAHLCLKSFLVRSGKLPPNAVEDSQSVRILRHFTHSVEAEAKWTGLEPSFSSVYDVLPAAICIRP